MLKWTTKGRIEVRRNGELVSRHILDREAWESVSTHATAHGPGKYVVTYPNVEVDVMAVTIVSTDTQAPTQPGAFAVTAPGTGGLRLTWSPSTDGPPGPSGGSGLRGYRVFRATLPAGPFAQIALVDHDQPNEYTDLSVGQGASRSYYIDAVDNAANVSPPTAVQTATVADTTAPTVPAIAAVALSTSGIEVSIVTPSTDSGSGLSGYDIEYKRAVDPSWIVAGTNLPIGSFPLPISGLQASTTYDLRPRARDQVGNVSPYGSTVQVATQAGSPSLAGWTDLDALINSPAYAASRIVYVSTSGNDATGQIYSPASAALGGVPTNPTGTVAPYATLAAAWAQIRNGSADVMLMRRGDIWTTHLNLAKAGPSPTARIIVSAYGPLVANRPQVGRVYPDAQTTGANQLLAHYRINFAANGDQFVRGSRIAFEGMYFQGFGDPSTYFVFNVSNGISFIRCAYNQCRTINGEIVGRGNLIFWDNAMWHPLTYVGGGVSEHNNYFGSEMGDVDSRRNISANSPGVGWRQRGYGRVETTLVLAHQRFSAFDIGWTSNNVGSTTAENNGTYLIHRYNIALHSPNSTFQNLNIRNAVVEENIILPGQIFTYLQALDNPLIPPTTDVLLQDNIFYGAQLIGAAGHSNVITGPYLIRRNDFQRPAGGALINAQSNDFTYEANNRFFSSSPQGEWFNGYTGSYAAYVPSRGSNTNVSYPDPNRNMITYMQTLGVLPSSAAQAIDWFMNGVPGRPDLAGALNNRLGAWDERFTAAPPINHVRAGFGKGAIP